MYLTQQTDYAMRVLIYAAVNDGVLVNIGTIAEAYKISKSHLMKVVTALVKGGFLISVRGKGGGLRLAKSAEEIRVGDVVRLIEPMQIAECFGSNNQCVITPHCRLADVLHGGLRIFLQHLDGFTLAELINRPTSQVLQEPHIAINAAGKH